jgi:recombination protein RecR
LDISKIALLWVSFQFLRKIEDNMRYPETFERLVSCFSKFQGIGRKTAERLVFDLVTRWEPEAVHEFAQALSDLPASITICPECRTHIEALPCPFCSDYRRFEKALCIVATSKDAYSVESMGLFNGIFYVLGGLLSPLNDNGVEGMDIEKLKNFISSNIITEVILALDSSLEGDATVSFLRNELQDLHIKISRLAAGVPVGASLELVDRGTLRRAFSGRQQL